MQAMKAACLRDYDEDDGVGYLKTFKIEGELKCVFAGGMYVYLRVILLLIRRVWKLLSCVRPAVACDRAN